MTIWYYMHIYVIICNTYFWGKVYNEYWNLKRSWCGILRCLILVESFCHNVSRTQLVVFLGMWRPFRTWDVSTEMPQSIWDILIRVFFCSSIFSWDASFTVRCLIIDDSFFVWDVSSSTWNVSHIWVRRIIPEDVQNIQIFECLRYHNDSLRCLISCLEIQLWAFFLSFCVSESSNFLPSILLRKITETIAFAFKTSIPLRYSLEFWAIYFTSSS